MNFDQLRDQVSSFWNALAPSQRATMGLVALLIAAGLGYLATQRGSNANVPISAGKAFTVEEAMHAEQVLLAAGLDDFELRGGQLLVPRGEAERYNAALIAGGGLPSNWAEEWEAQMKDLGQFAGSRQRAEVMEIARAKMVSSYLSQLPDIAHANVVWDEDRQPGFRAASKTRATVFLRAKPGHTIDHKTVSAVRMAVANSKKYLAPEDVVVMDIAGQKTYDGNDTEFGDEAMTKIVRLTSMYEDRVRSALDYIPGVVVTANVNLERLRESLVRKQQINPKETLSVIGNTTRNTDSLQQTASTGEPGGGPNVQLDLQTGRGPTQTRESSQNEEQLVQTASFEITESSLIGGMADSVSMSVSIPMDYYRAVAMTLPAIKNNAEATDADIDAAAQKVEQDTIAAVQTKVAQLLPPAPVDDPNFRSVIVDSITVPPTTEEEVTIPMTVTIAGWVKAYSQPVVLLGLALVALFMLNKSLSRPMPELPELKLPEPPSPEDADADNMDDYPDPFSPPGNKRRERLQEICRESPQIGAAVISSWLAESR